MTESRKKKIRAVVVDDEPLARQNILLLLKDDADVEVVGQASSGPEAAELIARLAPDLVFLDIQMPEMDGFEVLGALDPARVPVVVFVTAYDRYALRAFEVHALDYLLKPFDDARFEKALAQAKRQIEGREVQELSRRLFALLEARGGERTQSSRQQQSPPQHLTRLLVKTAGRVFFLKADEIDWIGAEDNYVKLHVGRRGHLLRETMNELETKLDPQKFFRVHRSAIVNLDRVRELQQLFNGEYAVVLHDGTELKLSRGRREQLQTLLAGGRA